MDHADYIRITVIVIALGVFLVAISGALIGLAVGFTLGKWPAAGYLGSAWRGGLIGGLTFTLVPFLPFIAPIALAGLLLGVMVWLWRERSMLIGYVRRLGYRKKIAALSIGMFVLIIPGAIFVTIYFSEQSSTTPGADIDAGRMKKTPVWVSGPFDDFTPDKTLDASGLNAPLPVLRTNKTLSSMRPGNVLLVISTDPSTVKDFEAYCHQTGTICLQAQVEQGNYRFLFRKTGNTNE